MNLKNVLDALKYAQRNAVGIPDDVTITSDIENPTSNGEHTDDDTVTLLRSDGVRLTIHADKTLEYPYKKV